MLTLIRCPFHPLCYHSLHSKDPGHSAKRVGGRIELNTYTPLTRRSRSGLTMLSLNSVGTYQGNELTLNSSVNARPRLSPLAESLFTDFNLKS